MFIITVLYSVKTMSRNADWKDNITLYTHDVEPMARAKTHYYLGNELIKKVAEDEKDSIQRMAILNKGILEVKKADDHTSPNTLMDGLRLVSVFTR